MSRKKIAPKAGPVWHLSAEEATLAGKPRYNGFACGHGAHGSVKYNRARAKRAWSKELTQERTHRGSSFFGMCGCAESLGEMGLTVTLMRCDACREGGDAARTVEKASSMIGEAAPAAMSLPPDFANTAKTRCSTCLAPAKLGFLLRNSEFRVIWLAGMSL